MPKSWSYKQQYCLYSKEDPIRNGFVNPYQQQTAIPTTKTIKDYIAIYNDFSMQRKENHRKEIRSKVEIRNYRLSIPTKYLYKNKGKSQGFYRSYA